MSYCTSCGANLSPTQETTAVLPDTTHDSGSQQRIDRANKLVGLVLDGKYKLNKTLGVGGMGAVYSATRMHIGDEVAVKILHPERTADKSAADRFRREAQIAARLKHPNAVNIYDFGVTADGFMYLVMEQVSGHSLRHLLKEHSPLALGTVIEITNQVCSALAKLTSKESSTATSSPITSSSTRHPTDFI